MFIVCVLGSKCLTFFCWEMILKVQNVVWILGWLACLIAFMSVFFSSLKNLFQAISTAPRHLLTPSLSIELFSCFLLQSQHLSIAMSIDQETFCPLDSSSTDRWQILDPSSFILPWTPLDTYSIDASIDLIISQHLSIYRELVRFYK